MTRRTMDHAVILAFLGVVLLVAASPVVTPPDPSLASIGRYLPGYVPREELPDASVLLPAPPDSDATAVDDAVSRRSLSRRDTARWGLAVEDANLVFPHAAGTFSCALGAPITTGDTPALYRLLRRSSSDAGLSTGKVKDRYQRLRPLAVNGQPVCTPDERARLMKSGSFPSAHAAIGWAWALILAEIAPERAGAVLARGRAFGQSRVVCNAHWQSDVEAGQLVGAVAVARMHASPEFRADVEAARVELASARAGGLPPSRDCAAEKAALTPVPPP